MLFYSIWNLEFAAHIRKTTSDLRLGSGQSRRVRQIAITDQLGSSYFTQLKTCRRPGTLA